MLLFSKKLLNNKIFKTLFPIKKVIFIFVTRRHVPFRGDWGLRNNFLPFFQKIQLILKKLLNNKILSTSFVIKKVMLIFGGRCLLSLKNCQMCSKSGFSLFLSKKLYSASKASFTLASKSLPVTLCAMYSPV